MNLIISVDTEADNQWDRNKGPSVTLDNLAAIPRFQELCTYWGFPPTYLLTYEVATSSSAKTLGDYQKAGSAEVGAHLHPWTTPPFISDTEKLRRDFPNNLPPEQFKSKLKSLTTAIETGTGRRPTSFRAGRWGFAPWMTSYLINEGYTVDSSISPQIDWSLPKFREETGTGPNFSTTITINPYYLQDDTGRRLLEVPVTVAPIGIIRKIDSKLFTLVKGIRTNNLRTLTERTMIRPRWCRIFRETTLDDLIKIYESAHDNKSLVLVFMIHSSELITGSPYTKTETEVEHVFATLGSFLSEMKHNGVNGGKLSDLPKLFN